MAAETRSWGYIEGYYGRLFTWQERAGLLSRLGSLGANTYLYAPKEDTLHRRDWRLPYDARWKKSFAALVAQGVREGVRVVPGMAPGLSFRYLDSGDYRILLRKLKVFASLGCRVLALLMDDITPALPADSRRAFRSLGEAHGRLLARLRADLGEDVELWFCPTVYTDQFASGPVAKDPYLLDLAATLPRDVPLMWTGPRIISEKLSGREIGTVARMFRGNVIIWDNLYANDYCPSKLFAGPYAGRAPELWKLTRGVLLNPTGLPLTDGFLLGLLDACRRGKKPIEAWKAALREMDVPSAFGAVADFLASPFFRASPSRLTPRKVATMRKALKTLIWDWKGPLHREWYPFLFMLDADLKASARGKEAPDAAWIRKRYPPLIARLLLGR
jgi:hyaluronoglucosaminidase